MQEKILGWDIEEIRELLDVVNKNCDKRMLDVFADFARKSGRKMYSVRNFYYNLLHEVTCSKRVQKLLQDNNIILKETNHFVVDDEIKLLKEILLDNGKSVRATCLSLANGEKAKAIRYQNKYRNLIKNKHEFVKSIANEILESGQKCRLDFDSKIIQLPLKKQKQNIITEEEIQSLFCGLVRLVKMSAEQELESRQNYQIKIENSKLGAVELDNKRKEVLINELREQNNLLRAELDKVRNENNNYEQSYIKIQNLVKDNKMAKLRDFMLKFNNFEQKSSKER